MRTKLSSALTTYDRKRENKRGYNPHALSQYFAALDNVFQHVDNGVELRDAITGCFLGRLADMLLRTAGLEIMTKDECMFPVELPELEAVPE